MRTGSKNRSVLDYSSEDDLVKALGIVQISDSANGSASSSSSEEDGSKSRNEDENDWRIPTESDFSQAGILPQSVQNEVQRLQTLKSYSILDTEREEAFDEITERAYHKYNVPWACISLVDLGRQWIKSLTKEDIDLKETPRKDAMCAHTILNEDGILIVPDTHQDARFRDNPMVTGAPGFRFYAGASLISPEGHRLGALCILDKEPHPEGLSEAGIKHLKDMAKEVVDLMVLRRRNLQMVRKRTASEAEVKHRTSDVSTSSARKEDTGNKKSRISDSPAPTAKKISSVIQRPKMDNAILPDPKTSGVDPDEYLVQLVEAQWGIKLKFKPALELEDFFPTITEEQMAAYNMQVVSECRNNHVAKLRETFQQQGREALDCFNRFGEGLLNMSCRRGFKEIVEFLLSDEVNLDVRIRDDYGRTPLSDCMWNPEPQLEICTWIMEKDPSLFLISDKRGYTPFQYARKSDWHIWRQFLYDRREHLQALTEPEILSKFL